MRVADRLHLIAGAALFAAVSVSSLAVAEGRRLYDARHFDEACDKLAARGRPEGRWSFVRRRLLNSGDLTVPKGAS